MRSKFGRLIFSALLVTSTSFSSFQIAHAAGAVINTVTEDRHTANPGDTIQFSVDGSCGSDQISQVGVFLVDPNGINLGPGLDFINKVSGKSPLVSSGQFNIPLKITSFATPGTYRVQYAYLSCALTGQTKFTLNGSLDFQVTNSNIPIVGVPQVDSINLSSHGLKVGDNLAIEIKAHAPGNISSIFLAFKNTSGDFLQTVWFASQAHSFSNKIDAILLLPLSTNNPSGDYSFYSLNIDSIAGSDVDLASWNTISSNNNQSQSTSTISRIVSYGSSGNAQTSPANLPYTQLDTSTLGFSVINNVVTQRLSPPIISSISLDSGSFSAGDDVTMKIGVEPTQGLIYYLSGEWGSMNDQGGNTLPLVCSDFRPANPIVDPMVAQPGGLFIIRCKSTRLSTLGEYYLQSLRVAITSCDVANLENTFKDPSPCVNVQTNTSSTSYQMQNFSAGNAPGQGPSNPIAYSNPPSTGISSFLFASVPRITLTLPLAYKAPQLYEQNSTISQVSFFYDAFRMNGVEDNDCTWTSPSGTLRKVSSYTPYGRSLDTIIVDNLPAASAINIQGTCKSVLDID